MKGFLSHLFWFYSGIRFGDTNNKYYKWAFRIYQQLFFQEVPRDSDLLQILTILRKHIETPPSRHFYIGRDPWIFISPSWQKSLKETLAEDASGTDMIGMSRIILLLWGTALALVTTSSGLEWMQNYQVPLSIKKNQLVQKREAEYDVEIGLNVAT